MNQLFKAINTSFNLSMCNCALTQVIKFKMLLIKFMSQTIMHNMIMVHISFTGFHFPHDDAENMQGYCLFNT